MSAGSALVLAYFLPGEREDGERVRLAVSDGPDPLRWTAVDDARPVVASAVGERGMRDPFLLRDEARGLFVMLATDLRTWPDEDWDRAVRHGSRGILVAESPDLVTWSAPRLVRVAPPGAGNAWAPKAFRDDGTGEWLVVWASALYEEGDDRGTAAHQRLLSARTRDFATFSPARIALDTGRDVIDATYLRHGDRVLRFTVEDASGGDGPPLGSAITCEVGDSLEGRFSLVTRGIGSPDLVRGEGPSVFPSPGGDTTWMLVDEFGLRGYQLLESADPLTGVWRHRADAALPPDARHGSVIAVTAEEAAPLRGRVGAAAR